MKPDLEKKQLVHLFLASLALAAGLCLGLQKVPFFNGINDLILDYFIYFNGERVPHESVRVIQIDDATVTDLGRPVPRRILNQLMRELAKQQTSTQVFDLCYFNPTHAAEDSLLAFLTDSIQHVVQSFRFENNPNDADSIAPELSEKYAIAVQNYEKFSPIRPNGVTFPIASMLKHFSLLGSITYQGDVDGRLRRIPLVLEYADYCYPTLSLAALLDYYRLDQPGLRIEKNFWGLTAILDTPAQPVRIPINARGQVLLNFYGVLDVFQPYSLSHLLKLLTLKPTPPVTGLVPDFKDKIVLVGNTESQTDRHPSPFSVQFPGVGFHATLLSNFLNQECLRELPWHVNLLITVIVVFIFLLVFLYCCWRRRATWTFWLIFIAGILIFNLVAFFIFFKLFKLWLALWHINLTATSAFIGIVMYDKTVRVKNLNQKIRALENEIFNRLVNLDQIDKMIHSQTEQYKTVHYFASELRTVLRQPEVEQQGYLEKLFLSILENQDIIKDRLLQEIDQLKTEKARVQLEKEKLEFQKNLYERFIDSDQEIQAQPAVAENSPAPAQIAQAVLGAFHYFQKQGQKVQSGRMVYQGMVALANIPDANGSLRKTSMGEIFEQLKLVSGYDSTVLITGEPGTGKELVARAIHELSPRHRKPLVTINCAAIPENLLESELFGHVRGAFTHAVADRVGAFERAEGGTIFLDEIGDLKLDLQAKLLRVLQEKEVQKVGSNQMLQVNVRVIAATNQDLNQAIQQHTFRNDLYFRLNVVNLQLPPLRARKYDIPFLLQFFINEFNAHYHQEKSFAPEAILAAICYDWPGNIRMLQHFVEKMGVLTPTNVIQRTALPGEIQSEYQQLFQKNITPLWQEVVRLTRLEYERLFDACQIALQTALTDDLREANPLNINPPDCYEYLRSFVQNLTSFFSADQLEALVRKFIVQMQDELFQWCRHEKIAKLGNVYEIIEKLLGRSRRQIDNWRTQSTSAEISLTE